MPIQGELLCFRKQEVGFGCQFEQVIELLDFHRGYETHKHDCHICLCGNNTVIYNPLISTWKPDYDIGRFNIPNTNFYYYSYISVNMVGIVFAHHVLCIFIVFSSTFKVDWI